jgi:hypothetical protein
MFLGLRVGHRGCGGFYGMLLDMRLGLVALRCRAVGGDIVEVLGVFQLHKVGDVEERVALQANVDKRRLHSREYAGYASFVDGTCQGVFIFALEVDFREQIVFDQPHFGLVRCGRHK